MSDFFQILQREEETKRQKETLKEKANFNIEKKSTIPISKTPDKKESKDGISNDLSTDETDNTLLSKEDKLTNKILPFTERELKELNLNQISETPTSPNPSSGRRGNLLVEEESSDKILPPTKDEILPFTEGELEELNLNQISETPTSPNPSSGRRGNLLVEEESSDKILPPTKDEILPLTKEDEVTNFLPLTKGELEGVLESDQENILTEENDSSSTKTLEKSSFAEATADKKEDYLELSRQFIEKVEILKQKRLREREEVLSKGIKNPIWLTLAEAAKFSGVDVKTIRRAVKASPGTEIRYKIQNNKYVINLKSLILYMHSNTKLKNKLYQNGLGQYVKEFKS